MATAEQDPQRELEYERTVHASNFWQEIFIQHKPLTVRRVENFLENCLASCNELALNPYRPKSKPLGLDDEEQELQFNLETLPQALRLDTPEGRKAAVIWFERRAIRITKLLQLEPRFETVVYKDEKDFLRERGQLLRSKCWEAAGLLRMIQAGISPQDLKV